MRILHIGDIVGKPGRDIVVSAARELKSRYKLDLLIANAENIAGGSGITPAIYKELITAGVDGITLGDHIYRRREIYKILENEPNIVKPGNFPEDSPGKEFMVLTAESGEKIAVISLLGRLFMRPTDCPWKAADRILPQIPEDVKAVLVDFHAEATSEKQLMGRYLDGRVSAVLGTHTHVPTADECILPEGTAFQCDLGMTGPHDSILGRRVDRVMETTVTFRPTQFDVATGDVRIRGAVVELDAATGRAKHIERICVLQEEVSQWTKAKQ